MRLSGVPGITASVRYQGSTAIPEWPDPDTPDESECMTRYIQAVEGTLFSINMVYATDFRHRGNAIKQEVWIDGRFKHNSRHDPETLDEGVEQIISKPNRGPRGLPRKAFEWKSLTVTDEAPPKLDNAQRQALESVGMICVKLFRMEGQEEVSEAADETEVPESKLKGRGIYIGVDWGEATATARTIWKPIDEPDEPWAQFIFLYRSHKALRELRIIEPDWTGKRKRRMARRELEEHERMLRNIKKEKRQDGDGEDSDDCVIDEQRSTIVPLKKAWIDASLDGCSVVHEADPGWFKDILKSKKKRAGVRGRSVINSRVTKKPKVERRLSQNYTSGNTVPMMSGGRSDHLDNRLSYDGNQLITPESEDDDIFGANDVGDAEMTAEEGEEEDDDNITIAFSHARDSVSHRDVYGPSPGDSREAEHSADSINGDEEEVDEH